MAKKKIYKIGLVDADLLNGGTRHPNLVLLKIAGFLRDHNIEFHLIIDKDEDIAQYDVIYMSKVFSYTPNPPFYEKAKGTPDEKKFIVGGTGGYAIEKSGLLVKIVDKIGAIFVYWSELVDKCGSLPAFSTCI